MLDANILTSETEIHAIADEWRQLHARVGHSVFSDYDVVCIWWRTIGRNHGSRSLHIVTGRKDGRLVAVLPLTVVRQRGSRILQAAGYKGYNYCDMLAEDAAQAAALWQAARASPHYDFADVRDVYPQSMCYQALSSFARRRDLTEALYLNFQWPTSKGWLASLPRKANTEFRRHMRRLEEKAPVRYVCHEEVPPADIIDRMVKLKKDWCVTNGETGLFDQPGVHDYFHQLFDAAARQGRLHFNWLQCGEDIIAYMVCLRYQDVLQGYVIAYDPVWAAYSPGIVLLTEVVCRAIDSGCRGLDMRQGAGRYKSRFTNEERHCAEFTFSGSLSGKLIEGVNMGVRALWRMGKSGAPASGGREPVAPIASLKDMLRLIVSTVKS